MLYFHNQHPLDLLMLVDNNVFLGWTMSTAAATHINQLRWKYKNQAVAGRGLAAARLPSYSAPRDRGARR
jgi:hypothetical protein